MDSPTSHASAMARCSRPSGAWARAGWDVAEAVGCSGWQAGGTSGREQTLALQASREGGSCSLRLHSRRTTACTLAAFRCEQIREGSCANQHLCTSRASFDESQSPKGRLQRVERAIFATFARVQRHAGGISLYRLCCVAYCVLKRQLVAQMATGMSFALTADRAGHRPLRVPPTPRFILPPQTQFASFDSGSAARWRSGGGIAGAAA